MGFKTNFGNILLGAGNQVIDTMNIEAAREADQTRQGIAEATSQWNSTLKKNKQAYENYIEFLNFIKSHPDQFTGNWDRRLSALYQDQPSLFKGESFDAIKDNVAKALSTYKIREEKLGEEVESPYVSSADYFNANQDNIRNHIGDISGMSNVVNLMTSEKEFAKGTTDLSKFEQLEGTFKQNITTATMTAYGYGILRQEPTNRYNQKLLEIEKLRIIAANAQKYTTQESKSKFLANAINENVIDLASIYMFNKPITGKLLLDLFQRELQVESALVEKALTHFSNLETGLANKDPNVTPEMVAAARTDYENKRNEMYGKVNQHIYSTIGQTIPFDVGQVQVKEEPEKIEEPQKIKVPEDYNPRINSRGEINLIDGSKVSIEDILADIETYKKTQPPEFINYIQQFSPLFDDEGDMIRPTRDMFTAGKAGDTLFKKFDKLWKNLNPEEAYEELPKLGTSGQFDIIAKGIDTAVKSFLEKRQIKEEELKEIKPKKKK
tara:strand:+ start:567 stop:2051 length:1485 start_codon:yes stop_codon:yes gene_type:complete